MDALRSFDTSVYTQRHIPEDGILHSPRRKNLRSYINSILFRIGALEAILHEAETKLGCLSPWT
jgi:hypothetical protein